MGYVRLLYNNYITSSTMLTVSTAKTGIITSALKSGTGSAVISLSGTYVGSEDREYVAEIITTGTSTVGAATLKWSDSGGATWNASSVVTSTAASTMTDGVSYLFANATMTFVEGDKWYFKGINMFAPSKMLDMDRDKRFRSGSLETTNLINITLPTTAQSTAFALVLYDHNLTSAAVITLIGATAASTGSSFSAPKFSTTIAWSSAKILQYCTAAEGCRYWQLKISNTAITDGYIEIGELFLGSYLQLTENIVEGYSESNAIIKETNTSPYGIERYKYYNTGKTFSVSYQAVPTTDADALRTMVAALGSRSQGTLKPFFFNMDSTLTAQNWMVAIDSLEINHLTRNRFNIPITLKEVQKSV